MNKPLLIIAVVFASVAACLASEQTVTISNWSTVFMQNHSANHANVNVQGVFVLRCGSGSYTYYCFDSRQDPVTAELLLWAKDKGKTVDISYDNARSIPGQSNYWLLLSVIVR